MQSLIFDFTISLRYEILFKQIRPASFDEN